MNEKLKTFFIIIGAVLASIAAFIFGRNINGRRVRPNNNGLKQINRSIGELEKRKQSIEAGIEQHKRNLERGLGKIDKRSSSITEHNKLITDGLQSAIETLKRAKERSNNKKP